MYASIGFLAGLAATVVAKTIVITAGTGGLAFSPDTVTAAVGDVLEFHFVGSIHSAVQGDFSSPCVQSSGGFDSGKISSASVFQVTVKTTDPMWFFCATPTHCQGGMAGVVNPPSTGDSLAAYKSAAGNAPSSSSSGKVSGGVVLPVGSSGSSSSATPAPPSTASSAGAAASTVSGVATASPSSMTSAGAGSPTTSSSGTTSPTPNSTGAGNSLIETSGNIVLLGLVFGLGAFVVLMA
ncbi:Cupredoxin [Hyaloscypha finlandica]|nr:Cupredoxin [Hyaloscypha sp. PMI_1271]KAH8748758.1 Cupredoxin [Hyaloscypha finlandica]